MDPSRLMKSKLGVWIKMQDVVVISFQCVYTLHNSSSFLVISGRNQSRFQDEVISGVYFRPVGHKTAALFYFCSSLTQISSYNVNVNSGVCNSKNCNLKLLGLFFVCLLRGYKSFFGDNTWEESSRDSCTDVEVHADLFYECRTCWKKTLRS